MSEPLIQLFNLSKKYSVGEVFVEALRGISLVINRGEWVAIVGASGSGKSTLLHLMGLLDSPSAGRYLLDSHDATGLSNDARATIRNKKIGFVLQNANLLARHTAIENVELPLIYDGVSAKLRRERATAALTTVGLAHRFDHWPQQLSGGEQQRVALARALVNNPTLILADEPTGALDSRTGGEIIALLQHLHRMGHTIIMVTHDPNVAQHATRILSIGDGQLVSDEVVAETMNGTARDTQRVTDESRVSQ